MEGTPQPPWPDVPLDSPLGACGPQGWAALSEAWVEQSHPRGVAIITMGDASRDVFFVLAGRVRVTSYASSGREVPFVELGPGACVGELAALDGGTRSSNVITLADSHLGRLTALQFERALMRHRTVLRAVAGHLAGRVRDLSTRLLDVTTMDARQRLLVELLRLSVPDPETEDRGLIPSLPTQQELANAIVGQREAVARQLSALAREGLIVRDRRRLEIPSLRALRQGLTAGPG